MTNENQLMSLGALKDMGIDFKLSKSDILDMLVEQARVSLTEETEAAGTVLNELADAFNAAKATEEKAHNKAELDAVKNDPKVKAMKAAIEAYYDCKLKVVEYKDHYFLMNKAAKNVANECRAARRDRHYGYGPRMMMFMDPYYGGAGEGVQQLRTFDLERGKAKFKISEETEVLRKQWKEAKKVHEELSRKLNNFQYDASRARLKVLRQFLSVTEEGQKLLGLLDSSRNGKQIMKALKKG